MMRNPASARCSLATMERTGRMASSGATKECTQCREEKYRYDFEAGSEVCRSCQMDGDRPEDNPLLDHPMQDVQVPSATAMPDDEPGGGAPTPGLLVPPGLLAYMRQTMGLDEATPLDLAAFLAQ